MSTLPTRLADAIANAVGSRVTEARAAGGGCINEAAAVTLADGRRAFAKWNASQPLAMFEREAEGLTALRAADCIRVPEPIATGGGADGVPAFLLMEHIATGSQGRLFQDDLGRRLAALHRATTGARFGFDHDNWIGATPQPNAWSGDWVAFWRDRRLGHQLRLAHERRLADAELTRLGDRLMERLEEFIDLPEEPACLLHGDLWGGNVLADEHGAPVLIDPACYCGRREADLAMTLLFGGFSHAFHDAYQREWPLAPGSERRLDVYKLYHLLNHLNLFGSGYLGQCLDVLRRMG